MAENNTLKEAYIQTIYQLVGHGSREIQILKEAFKDIDGQEVSDNYGTDNAAKTFAGQVVQKNPYTGILFKLVDIFGEDPYVGGSQGDKIKVYFVEDKWRKYTSIMYPNSDYKLGAISDQFWLDVYVDKIESGVVTRSTQSTFMRNEDYLYTDQRAYEYKSSLGYWDNRTTEHEFYGIKFWSAS
jgi:hypothetical protein